MTSGPGSLRLYLTAALALAYVGAWWASGMRTGGTAAAPPPPPRTVWYDELPPSRRPPVSIPPGWYLAPSPATVRAAPPPVRAARARPWRVRTRSS